MLTSLIIAYFVLRSGVAAGFTSQLEAASKAIKKNVTVEATQKQALAIIDSATKANKAFENEMKSTQEAMVKVLSDRSATAAQIESAVQPLFVHDSAVVTQMLDASMRLRSVLSPAEWSQVFPPPPAK